jgi:hypothetical protein
MKMISFDDSDMELEIIMEETCMFCKETVEETSVSECEFCYGWVCDECESYCLVFEWPHDICLYCIQKSKLKT